MRTFLVTSLCLLLAVAGLAQQPAAPLTPTKVDLSKEKVVYYVATAHLDTNWEWTVQDTIRYYLPDTLNQNFAFFESYPNYVFNFEGSNRYGFVKEYYPDLYAKLKEYIAQGRWRVCGSAVEPGDVNLPSPESLVRQILYGNGYFKKEFGVESHDIFLPDCFGFPYTLPTIAAHCGLTGFSTQKLTWGSAYGIPFDVGTWQGVDGSKIIAALKTGTYGDDVPADAVSNPDELQKINAFGDKYGIYVEFQYYGTGDTGGAPSKAAVSNLMKNLSAIGPMKVVGGGADQMFLDMTPADIAKLPTYNGELVLTKHGTGCYTSQAAMKRGNRKNELLADAAEKISVAANWLGNALYPKARITDAWQRFLWHQFHDDLTGTSIPEVYVFSQNDEALAQNTFAQVVSDGAGAVARALDTRAQGQAVMVYNPLSIARDDVVEANVPLADIGVKGGAVRVYGPDGIETPSQFASALNADGTLKVTFLAHVPALGSAVYDVRPSAGPCALATGLAVSETGLENARYKVTLNADGDVASIFDKMLNKELLTAPLQIQLFTDRPGPQFPQWETALSNFSGAPRTVVAGPVSAKVVENGPARVTLEITRSAAGSCFVQRLQLCAGGAADTLGCDCLIDWRTQMTLVKASFPFTSANPMATYDLGMGTIQRGNDKANLYEVPAQQWADLTAKDGSYGAAVLNDCKYGWDKPSDGTLRLTLLHSPYDVTQDMGRHQFQYAIVGHGGNWNSGGAGSVPWAAARLNQPLLAFLAPKHAGALGKQAGFVTVNNPNVMVKALKQAEDSDEIVVRLQELAGAEQDVTLTFPTAVVSAREVNGQEEPLGPATVTNGVLVTSLKAYQPRAFALKLAPPAAPGATVVCKSLPLPFNANVVTAVGKTGGAFAGYAIPAELWPDKVVSNGITYTLGAKTPGAKNALGCSGQVIHLDPAAGNKLYVLAAADGDTPGTFTVGGTATTVTVQDMTADIGQWDHPTGPAFLKTAPVAWYSTHRHFKDGSNDPYDFCYLTSYALAVPAGATDLRLPDEPNIRVFAITQAQDDNADTQPAAPLVDLPIPVGEIPEPLPVPHPLMAAQDVPTPFAGLHCAYYLGSWQNLPDFAALPIAKQGTLPQVELMPDNANENWGERLTGYIKVPADGVYTFSLDSDDGSRLSIDNAVVVDNDGAHSEMEMSDQVGLKAGYHAITVDYFQGVVDQTLTLSWEGPGINKQEVPASALWHK